MRRALTVAAAILGFALLVSLVDGLSRPALDRVMTDVLPEGERLADGVRVAYFGISTLLISDGESDILIDGYFTRLASPLDALLDREIASDAGQVAAALEAAGIGRLDALFVQHSHFDHALDAPLVAKRTGATLHGSASTLNIGRGGGLPEAQLELFEPGAPVRIGAFTVTVIESRHVALPIGGASIGKTIDAPLTPPAHLWDYVEGGSYAFLVEHPSGAILIHGSAGWRDGQYDAEKADVLLLGVGGLKADDPATLDAYIAAVADKVGAARVIPIHFEDLFPGDIWPRLPPRALGDAGALLAALEQRLGARYAMLAYGRPTLLLPPAAP